MAVTGVTITGNVIQVSYEGRDKIVDALRRAARKIGWKAVSGSMGEQVTPVGRVRLNMTTIFHDGDPYRLEAEISACQKADVFRGRY